MPESNAVDLDGNADEIVRQQIRRLWQRFSVECSTLGFPGQGGLTINALFEQILREVVLSGECLIYFRPWTTEEAAAMGLTIPLTIEVIEAERLDHKFTRPTMPENPTNKMYEGIEVEAETWRRVAYHVLKHHPNHLLTTSLETVRIPAENILHVYRQDRASSQLRGYSWFAPVLDTFRQIADFQFNELIASTIASCMAVVIESDPTNTTMAALAADPADAADDSDGNRKLFTQPGMVASLNPGEKLSGFVPQRPNDKVEDFVKHLLRGISGVFPLKASELHGDYRESSFSSEASAENSLMPNILSLHEWFVSSVCDPIFERFIITARTAGLLNGLADGDPYETRLVEATWPMPETRTINPANDVKAAQMRICAGLSSVQHEAAKLGNNDWETTLEQNAEYMRRMKEAGLPDVWGLNVLGVPTAPVVDPSNPDEPPAPPPKPDDGGDDKPKPKPKRPKPKAPKNAA